MSTPEMMTYDVDVTFSTVASKMMSSNDVAYVDQTHTTGSVMNYFEDASYEVISNVISTFLETQTGLNVKRDRIQSRIKNSKNGFEEKWLETTEPPATSPTMTSMSI
jgi:hypothetical protein